MAPRHRRVEERGYGCPVRRGSGTTYGYGAEGSNQPRRNTSVKKERGWLARTSTGTLPPAMNAGGGEDHVAVRAEQSKSEEPSAEDRCAGGGRDGREGSGRSSPAPSGSRRRRSPRPARTSGYGSGRGQRCGVTEEAPPGNARLHRTRRSYAPAPPRCEGHHRARTREQPGRIDRGNPPRDHGNGKNQRYE